MAFETMFLLQIYPDLYMSSKVRNSTLCSVSALPEGQHYIMFLLLLAPLEMGKMRSADSILKYSPCILLLKGFVKPGTQNCHCIGPTLAYTEHKPEGAFYNSFTHLLGQSVYTLVVIINRKKPRHPPLLSKKHKRNVILYLGLRETN